MTTHVPSLDRWIRASAPKCAYSNEPHHTWIDQTKGRDIESGKPVTDDAPRSSTSTQVARRTKLTPAEAAQQATKRILQQEAEAHEQRLEIERERARVRREWRRGLQLLAIELVRSFALCGLILWTASMLSTSS